MHGLINRSIQRFVSDRFGAQTWGRIAAGADLDFAEFEAMLTYDPAITPRLLKAMSAELDRPQTELMEDIGAYLVSDPAFEPLRRLLRFGGVNFEEFLNSLDDLPERARIAVSDLRVPRVELQYCPDGRCHLICDAPVPGYGFVMMGILRAMADDYGALVVLDHLGIGESREIISIKLIEADYAEGRSFDLAARM